MPTRRAPLLALGALLIALTLAPVAWAGTAPHAAGAVPAQATDTPAPHVEHFALESSAPLAVEYRVTFGEIFITLSVLALAALLGLRFLYDLAHPHLR